MSWLAMKICLLAIGLQGACKLLAMRWHLLPDTFEVISGELCVRLTANVEYHSHQPESGRCGLLLDIAFYDSWATGSATRGPR